MSQPLPYLVWKLSSFQELYTKLEVQLKQKQVRQGEKIHFCKPLSLWLVVLKWSIGGVADIIGLCGTEQKTGFQVAQRPWGQRCVWGNGMFPL